VALGCSLAGAVLAARHVWLQGAHGVIHMCPAPIGRVFEQSWAEAARQLLLGARLRSLTWSFLDLTLPEWSLLAFLLLAVLPLSCLLAYRFRTLART
jgi:disulfide bond formation protein DsbB